MQTIISTEQLSVGFWNSGKWPDLGIAVQRRKVSKIKNHLLVNLIRGLKRLKIKACVIMLFDKKLGNSQTLMSISVNNRTQ